jgi:hypothetical protein
MDARMVRLPFSRRDRSSVRSYCTLQARDTIYWSHLWGYWHQPALRLLVNLLH